jgi:hypothetical protein
LTLEESKKYKWKSEKVKKSGKLLTLALKSFSFEDAIHYFLECPLYLNERRTLLSNCDDININIETLLFGNDKYSYDVYQLIWSLLLTNYTHELMTAKQNTDNRHLKFWHWKKVRSTNHSFIYAEERGWKYVSKSPIYRWG